MTDNALEVFKKAREAWDRKDLVACRRLCDTYELLRGKDFDPNGSKEDVLVHFMAYKIDDWSTDGE